MWVYFEACNNNRILFYSETPFSLTFKYLKNSQQMLSEWTECSLFKNIVLKFLKFQIEENELIWHNIMCTWFGLKVNNILLPETYK